MVFVETNQKQVRKIGMEHSLHFLLSMERCTQLYFLTT